LLLCFDLAAAKASSKAEDVKGDRDSADSAVMMSDFFRFFLAFPVDDLDG
jgi:hypothetical protein